MHVADQSPFEQVDLHTIAARNLELCFPELDASVLAVPDGPVPELSSDPTRRHNFLVIHAHVREVVPQYWQR